MSYPPPAAQPPIPAPPLPYATPATDKDIEHLRLLAMFHYIAGAVIALFSCFGLIHVFLGIMTIANPNFLNSNNPSAQPPPPFFGWIFLVAGASVVLLGWTQGALTILSGRFISRRRGWLFSMIVAGINCLWVPIGTILGIFTIMVLIRPTVKAMYEHNKTIGPQ